MAISHVKSNTINDMTGTVTVFNSAGVSSTAAATDLIRPSDWNSVHNQYYTLTGAQTAVQSTVSGTNPVWSGMGCITLVGSTATIGISGPLLSSYQPFPIAGGTTGMSGIPTATTAPVSVIPFYLPQALSAGVLDMFFSMSFSTLGTSSGRQSAGLQIGIYTRPTGANSTQLLSLMSTTASWAITGNNSTYSISQYTTTSASGYGAQAQTSSAGSNITSQYTGMKKIGFPINQLLTAGNYWLGILGTNSTNSINVGVSLSWLGVLQDTKLSSPFAPMGSLSSAYTSGGAPEGGMFLTGLGSWTSAGSSQSLPVSMGFASITGGNLSILPFLNFWLS